MKLFSSIIILYFIIWPFVVYAQNHVGVILAGYENDCEVNHLGTVYECADRRELFVGDTVKKKPSVKALKIKWAPYVRGAERGQTYLEVVANKPETLKGSALANAVKQYVHDFVKAPAYGTTAAATRDPKANPSSFISLIYDYPLKIEHSGDDRSVFIFDSKGNKIWENRIKGGRGLAINPRELALNPNEKYMFVIETVVLKKASVLILMDETMQNEIRKGIADIEEENTSATDLLIRKVTYCQLVSDVYPDKVDLYWLGNQFLEENYAKPTGNQKLIVEGLQKRYQDHLRSTR